MLAGTKPLNFESAKIDRDLKHAMDEKIKAIKRNNTWKLTTIPKSHKAIGVK